MDLPTPGTNRHTLYYNLDDALGEEGCPICRLCAQGIDRYLGHLLYESVNDLDVRRSVRESQGFCRQHGWALQEKGDALGIAIIHQDVLSNILRAVTGEGQTAGNSTLLGRLGQRLPGSIAGKSRKLARKLAPTGRCPVCQQHTEIERAYLQTLLEHYADPDLLSRLRASDGLCWPHFLRALQEVQDHTTLRLLIDTESAHLENLREELGEFIRRHDYHWTERSFGSEADSWIRAIAKVSGGHNQS